MARKFEIVSKETGEVFEGEEKTPPKRGGISRLEGFVQVWFGPMVEMGITGRELRVFGCLAHTMGIESGFAQSSPQMIAEFLDMSPKHASICVSRLVERGALRRVKRGVVFVNPNIAWRGAGGHRRTAQMRWMNPDMSYRPEWLEREDAQK